jgi:hypothetical protein
MPGALLPYVQCKCSYVVRETEKSQEVLQLQTRLLLLP